MRSDRASTSLLITCTIGVSLLAIAFTGQSILASTNIELWYLHHSYLTSEDAVQSSKALIDKAAAAGYTGAVFWDSSFNFMGDRDWDPDNEDCMKEVMKYARKRHLKIVAEVAPFGWSNDVLSANPNWAEAQRVIGARFEVTPDGRNLKVKNTLPPLVNGHFESSQTGWFALGDPDVKVVPGAYAGHAALTIVNPTGNARIRQQLAV